MLQTVPVLYSQMHKLELPICRKETTKLISYRGWTICELLTGYSGMNMQARKCTCKVSAWSRCTLPLLNSRCQDLWLAFLPT